MLFRTWLACIVLIAPFVVAAQPAATSYENTWKKVDSLIFKKGLLQEADQAVKKIYRTARQENNAAQQTKALLYQFYLAEQTREEATPALIQEIEKASLGATPVLKALLKSYEASLYEQYLAVHRYQIYDRAETKPFSKPDIRTWSAGDFQRKISSLYQTSLQNEKLLQQTHLHSLEPLILKGNARHLRPTLFDLMANRALEYFESDEPGITKPESVFELDQAAAFASAIEFSKVRFNSRDTTSLKLQAIILHQKILQFHLNDKDPRPLIDADLQRLQFSYSHSIHPQKDSLYRQALEGIVHDHHNHPSTDQAQYLLAQWHADQENERIEPTSQHLIKAKEICDRVIKRKDSTEGKVNCLRLLQSLERKELSLQVEKVNLPGQPFRALVGYRNIGHLFVRIIPLSDTAAHTLRSGNAYQDQFWQRLQSLPYQSSYRQELVPVNDLRSHEVEIKLDALPVGTYGILTSVEEDFGTAHNILALQITHCSHIGWINEGSNYYVLHRENGQPLSGATGMVWYRQYHFPSRTYEQIPGETFTADSNGFFQLKPVQPLDQRAFRLELHYKDDHLFLEDDFYRTFRENSTESTSAVYTTYLFTDRSLYRPGQQLFFKGIVTSTAGKGVPQVANGFQTLLYLQDANGQRIDSIKVKTTAYGSYSGRFTLPGGKLNGTFALYDPVGNAFQSFSVEAYKRPKFQVTLTAPALTYQLNDTLAVCGMATAYAGNSISNAQVTYRVIRKTRFPLLNAANLRTPYDPLPQEGEQEISHGTTTTDADGAFLISFKAVPDAKADRRDQPVFYFEVQADVTDMNGESRSARQVVPVSWQTIYLTIETPATLPAAALPEIQVRAQNLNGSSINTTLTVTLTPLQQPRRLLRSRYWKAPDQFIYSEEEYHRYFPLDCYGNEDLPAFWPKKETLLRFTDTASVSGKLAWPSLDVPAGWYLMEVAARDERGHTITVARFLPLTDKAATTPFFYGKLHHATALDAKNSLLRYSFQSNLDQLTVIHSTQQLRKGNTTALRRLPAGTQEWQLPVFPGDQGGIYLSTAFLQHNRYYFSQMLVPLPHPEKDLSVTVSSFRDKTLPGSVEEWKITVGGVHADAKTAEVLTAMYDASLQQFKPHQWHLPAFWERVPEPLYYHEDPGFTLTYSIPHNGYAQPDYWVNKVYDRLLDLSLSPLTNRANKSLTGIAAESGEVIAPEANLQFENDNPEAKQGGVKKETLATPKLQQADAQTDHKALIPTRKNFNETAFFFPELRTDSNGEVSFSFTMPEALTEWRWMTLAHTRTLALGYTEKNILTQKALMVQPNHPRFLREGDRIDYSVKIVNRSSQELTGQIELQLLDPKTQQPVDGWFRNFFPNQYFTVPAGGSVPVSFTLEIPYQYNQPVITRILARSGPWTDGEETMLPVVSNRILVTEAIPFSTSGGGTHKLFLPKLDAAATSETLNSQALTIEYTRNPAWYALLALPYLMESPYESSEQVFHRLYANALGTWLLQTRPTLKAQWARWKAHTPLEPATPLQRNTELKSVLLEETPWVLEARNEADALDRLALLMDSLRMQEEIERNTALLQTLQTPNGGFCWFPGGPDDRYITQYILMGLGRLIQTGALSPQANPIGQLLDRGLPYLDQQLQRDYEKEIQWKKQGRQPPENHYAIHYLYLRSLLPGIPVHSSLQKIYAYYYDQLKTNWINQTLYMQGMIAITLFRKGDHRLAIAILKSLQQKAIVDPEAGMYWKAFRQPGYLWPQAGLESHALLTEAFTAILPNQETSQALKKWLLREKQTQHWPSTKATAAACYVLLKDLPDFSTITSGTVKIRIGNNEQVPPPTAAAFGYYKMTIPGEQVKPAMANITLLTDTAKDPSPSMGWGAVYWQYFENLDQITPAKTALQVKKKLFVERLTPQGPQLDLLHENDRIHPGEKIIVQLELQNDQPMEYVHLKDMRASCLEPLSSSSTYKYQGGLGYYETTKDLANHFFIAYLPKGHFLLEYPLQVTHTGTFSNGLTSVECLYAPAFTSHTESIRLIAE